MTLPYDSFDDEDYYLEDDTYLDDEYDYDDLTTIDDDYSYYDPDQQDMFPETDYQ